MDRRRMLLVTGAAVLAGAIPVPAPRADAAQGAYLFHDEFDGPAGSAPDPANWTVAGCREPIKNPVFWDRPENLGQYRDDRRNVFVDGNSNLVLRATKEGNPDEGGGIAGTYFSGKVQGTWWGASVPPGKPESSSTA